MKKLMALLVMLALIGIGCNSASTTGPGAEKPKDAAKDTPKVKDAPKPDMTKPDMTKPDMTKPDTTKPDTTKPDAPKPDASLPKLDAPNPLKDAPK